jgi:hypothetical protein
MSSTPRFEMSPRTSHSVVRRGSGCGFWSSHSRQPASPEFAPCSYILPTMPFQQEEEQDAQAASLSSSQQQENPQQEDAPPNSTSSGPATRPPNSGPRWQGLQPLISVLTAFITADVLTAYLLAPHNLLLATLFHRLYDQVDTTLGNRVQKFENDHLAAFSDILLLLAFFVPFLAAWDPRLFRGSYILSLGLWAALVYVLVYILGPEGIGGVLTEVWRSFGESAGWKVTLFVVIFLERLYSLPIRWVVVRGLGMLSRTRKRGLDIFWSALRYILDWLEVLEHRVLQIFQWAVHGFCNISMAIVNFPLIRYIDQLIAEGFIFVLRLRGLDEPPANTPKLREGAWPRSPILSPIWAQLRLVLSPTTSTASASPRSGRREEEERSSLGIAGPVDVFSSSPRPGKVEEEQDAVRSPVEELQTWLAKGTGESSRRASAFPTGRGRDNVQDKGKGRADSNESNIAGPSGGRGLGPGFTSSGSNDKVGPRDAPSGHSATEFTGYFKAYGKLPKHADDAFRGVPTSHQGSWNKELRQNDQEGEQEFDDLYDLTPGCEQAPAGEDESCCGSPPSAGPSTWNAAKNQKHPPKASHRPRPSDISTKDAKSSKILSTAFRSTAADVGKWVKGAMEWFVSSTRAETQTTINTPFVAAGLRPLPNVSNTHDSDESGMLQNAGADYMLLLKELRPLTIGVDGTVTGSPPDGTSYGRLVLESCGEDARGHLALGSLRADGQLMNRSGFHIGQLEGLYLDQEQAARFKDGKSFRCVLQYRVRPRKGTEMREEGVYRVDWVFGAAGPGQDEGQHATQETQGQQTSDGQPPESGPEEAAPAAQDAPAPSNPIYGNESNPLPAAYKVYHVVLSVREQVWAWAPWISSTTPDPSELQRSSPRALTVMANLYWTSVFLDYIMGRPRRLPREIFADAGRLMPDLVQDLKTLDQVTAHYPDRVDVARHMSTYAERIWDRLFVLMAFEGEESTESAADESVRYERTGVASGSQTSGDQGVEARVGDRRANPLTPGLMQGPKRRRLVPPSGVEHTFGVPASAGSPMDLRYDFGDHDHLQDPAGDVVTPMSARNRFPKVFGSQAEGLTPEQYALREQQLRDLDDIDEDFNAIGMKANAFHRVLGGGNNWDIEVFDWRQNELKQAFSARIFDKLASLPWPEDDFVQDYRKRMEQNMREECEKFEALLQKAWEYWAQEGSLVAFAYQPDELPFRKMEGMHAGKAEPAKDDANGPGPGPATRPQASTHDQATVTAFKELAMVTQQGKALTEQWNRLAQQANARPEEHMARVRSLQDAVEGRVLAKLRQYAQHSNEHVRRRAKFLAEAMKTHFHLGQGPNAAATQSDTNKANAAELSRQWNFQHSQNAIQQIRAAGGRIARQLDGLMKPFAQSMSAKDAAYFDLEHTERRYDHLLEEMKRDVTARAAELTRNEEASIRQEAQAIIAQTRDYLMDFQDRTAAAKTSLLADAVNALGAERPRGGYSVAATLAKIEHTHEEIEMWINEVQVDNAEEDYDPAERGAELKALFRRIENHLLRELKLWTSQHRDARVVEAFEDCRARVSILEKRIFGEFERHKAGTETSGSSGGSGGRPNGGRGSAPPAQGQRESRDGWDEVAGESWRGRGRPPGNQDDERQPGRQQPQQRRHASADQRNEGQRNDSRQNNSGKNQQQRTSEGLDRSNAPPARPSSAPNVKGGRNNPPRNESHPERTGSKKYKKGKKDKKGNGDGKAYGPKEDGKGKNEKQAGNGRSTLTPAAAHTGNGRGSSSRALAPAPVVIDKATVVATPADGMDPYL